MIKSNWDGNGARRYVGWRALTVLFALAFTFGALPATVFAEPDADAGEATMSEDTASDEAVATPDDGVVETAEPDGGYLRASDEAVTSVDGVVYEADFEESVAGTQEEADRAAQATGEGEQQDTAEAVLETANTPDDDNESEVTLTAQSTTRRLHFGSWTSWHYLDGADYDVYKLVVGKGAKVKITLQTKFKHIWFWLDTPDYIGAEYPSSFDESSFDVSWDEFGEPVYRLKNNVVLKTPVSISDTAWLSAGTYHIDVRHMPGSHGNYRIKAETIPTWKGATKMPVGSTATYTAKNGSIKLKYGGSYVSLKGNTLTAKKAVRRRSRSAILPARSTQPGR